MYAIDQKGSKLYHKSSKVTSVPSWSIFNLGPTPQPTSFPPVLCADSKLKVHRDGHLVSRISDLIIYSVEAAFLDNVVATYGPCE